MILAAGRGERMRPLTDTCPKPLLKVGGKALIQWHIESWVRVGCNSFVINHAWLGHQIEEALGDGRSLGCQIRYSPEETALETAGGIANALPLLGQAPFVVVNGDVFSDFPPEQLLKVLPSFQNGLLAHLIMVPNPPHNPNGDFGVGPDGLLLANGDNCLTFSGIGLYHPALFAQVGLGQPAKLAPLLRQAMVNGQVSGQLYQGLWQDIGTPERLRALDEALMK